MQQLTANAWTETGWRGCNPSFVATSDGVVVIDTPQLPTRAVWMRREAERHGRIRYVINTEHHVDHIFGNWYFRGAGTVVAHRGVDERFMTVYPELDPFAYAAEAIPTDDPEGAAIFPDRDVYEADMNRPTVVFTGDLTLRVGDHTFELLATPGHTPGQIAVRVPEEGLLFTGDTIFSQCQTWLMTSDVGQWLAALERLRGLDFNQLVPGHGPVTNLRGIDEQREALLEWEAAIARAIAAGWSREETVRRVSFADRWPVDVGQGHMMGYIQTLNAGSLWDKMTAADRGAAAQPELVVAR